MIRILNISLHNHKYGVGAEARFLHDSLSFAGIESELWIYESRDDYAGEGTKLIGSKKVALSSMTSYDALLSDDLMELFISCDLASFDIIHIHSIGSYFSPLLLPFLQIKPVVLSVYDAASYTAGCSHSAHCGQWVEKACASCPIYENDAEKMEQQNTVFRIKESLYKSQKLHVVCQNKYQQMQLGVSMLRSQDIVLLPPLYNEALFYPGDQLQARHNLGIAEQGLVLFLHGDASNDMENKIFSCVAYALDRLRIDGYHITLVYQGDSLVPMEAADMVRNLLPDAAPGLVGEYYRAADLNLYFSIFDQAYTPVLEAAACGLPTVLFDLAPARAIVDDKSVIFVPMFDGQALFSCLKSCIEDKQYITSFRRAAVDWVKSQGSGAGRFWRYIDLYKQVMGVKTTEQEGADGQERVVPEALMKREWSEIEAFLQKNIDNISEPDEQSVFIDKAFSELFRLMVFESSVALWDSIRSWMRMRRVSTMMKLSSPPMYSAHLQVCQSLRERLTAYFGQVDVQSLTAIDEEYNQDMMFLWQCVFLNVHSVLHRDAEEYRCPQGYTATDNEKVYPEIIIKTMYLPYPERAYQMDIRAILGADLPISLKIIFIEWLTTAPLYNGTELNRQQVLHYVKEVSQCISSRLEFVSSKLCLVLINHFVLMLWRISYLGGNNIETLRALGEFTRAHMEFYYPQFCEPLSARRVGRKESFRIGYISMNFRDHAVSQYMANRIFHHSKDRFWVKTFILKKNSDDVTERIKQYSDEWEEFDDFQNYLRIADNIKASKLDLLIFADIGMEELTYFLAAMNLAPKQAVLVGHGITTGLPTLDYYISGDHEIKGARAHYVEKLICLPRAGAAQMPPNKQQSESAYTRSQIGVPYDAVMFISCANGIKHYEKRDEIIIQILQRAPKAYVVIKPFFSQDIIDLKFSNRIMTKAKAAGVQDRLLLLPPLPSSNDVNQLLALADVQLDTYPYCGWTTNMEALSRCLPIVTQKGEMARSRWGARLLEVLGVREGIASSEAEYVEWAVRFSEDKNLREKVSAQIRSKVQVLFDGKTAQLDYEEVLTTILLANKRVKK